MEREELIRVGESLAPFSLPAADNTVWTLEHLLRSRRVLLAFYRRDCPASRLLFPFLERMHRRLHRAGLLVAGVAQDSHRDTLELADAFQITFPLLLDFPGFPVSREAGVAEVPTQILLASEGTVLEIRTGFSRQGQDQLFLRLARELGRVETSLFAEGDLIPETRAGWPSASRI